MTKDLAVAVFGRQLLATHGLSGKTGNANKGSTAKPSLDSTKVNLILGTMKEAIYYIIVSNDKCLFLISLASHPFPFVFIDIVEEKFPGVPRKSFRSSLREKMNDEHKLLLR